MISIKFPSTSQSFHAALKQRINDYFIHEGKRTTGNWKLFSKAIILLLAFVFLYIHLIFFTPAWYFAVAESALLGICVAAIGFNIMHDGAHGSFSRYKWVNYLAAFSLNLLGGSSFMWNVKHNMIHHAYTNIDGLDDDIDAKPFLRLSASQRRYKIHRFQYLYFWVLYCLLYMSWVFLNDFKKYFTHRIGQSPLKKMSLSDHIIFWCSKVLHYFLFIAIPVIKLGFINWLIGFLIFSMVAGLVLSIVFQLAHTVEHTQFPMPDINTHKMEDEWAVHQIKTTANFATKNKIVSWFTGGLNFQIEHHLFPKISHIHYPAISKIVKEVCEEFGLKYIEYKRMRYALSSHISHLKHLGKE